MRTRFRATQFLILFLTINSCGFEKGDEWYNTTLYAQKIEGTSKLLYKYDAWGGRDSHASGYVILDSTEVFKIDLSKKLDFYKLSNIPNKNKIEGITHECYNSCDENYNRTKPIFTPMKTKTFESERINIETLIYQYRGYSERDGGLGRYVFEKYNETKDSLFFYDLNDVESMNGIHLDELRLKKGEVYISENEKGEVNKITIEQTIINPKTKEFVDSESYFLTPKNNILIKNFSDRGIFREVKISK